jgi:5'-phosphate synthase pdxT subunit
MRIGILALQGSVKEHKEMLKKCGAEPVEVRLPHDLDNVYGLIIPGGESTTIGKLMKKYGLDKEIIRKYNIGMPIYGSCAGAIVLAKTILPNKQFSLKLIDIIAKRNDYGRQLDSFETDLEIEGIGDYKGIFIRAPTLEITNGVKILSEFEGKPVMAQHDDILVTTFHPELTKDPRVHQYFIDMIKKSTY